MPRSNNFAEVFHRLTSWKKYTPLSGGATDTTAEAITRDLADVDLVSGTGFTNGDYILISGSGGMELSKIQTVSVNNLLFDRPVLIPQDIGATVDEALESNLGHVSEEGITFGATQTVTPVRAATSATPLGYLTEAAELTFSGILLGDNNLNFLYAFGALEDEEGVGSAADPYATVVDGTTVSTEVAHALRATGSLHGGAVIEVDFLGITIEVNVSRNMGGTGVTGYGISGKCTAFLRRQWT
jgi:hypothetical protein